LVSTPQTRHAFFIPQGDSLAPEPIARSPWGETLHGRLIGGLTARAVGGVIAQDPDLICTRLTIDMFRTAPLTPVWVSTRPIREGRRIKVLEVTVEQADGPIGQGKAILLRRGEQPSGRFLPTPAWDVPTPHEMGDPIATKVRRFTAPWESWNITGVDSMDGLRGGLWIRENHDLVLGEPITPLIRVGLASDLASPVANSSTEGLGFINADYTVYLGREPIGEHVGIQPYGHISASGVAVAQCVLHDLSGPLGFISTTAVANSMARANEGAAPRA
jgi:hypothetical protein